jgi:hypothetical protein
VASHVRRAVMFVFAQGRARYSPPSCRVLFFVVAEGWCESCPRPFPCSLSCALWALDAAAGVFTFASFRQHLARARAGEVSIAVTGAALTRVTKHGPGVLAGPVEPFFRELCLSVRARRVLLPRLSFFVRLAPTAQRVLPSRWCAHSRAQGASTVIVWAVCVVWCRWRLCGLVWRANAAFGLQAQVFARVSPSQKEDIVAAMNASGRCTLMCGDGTNDVGALKQAHVGEWHQQAPHSGFCSCGRTGTLRKLDCLPDQAPCPAALPRGVHHQQPNSGAAAAGGEEGGVLQPPCLALVARRRGCLVGACLHAGRVSLVAESVLVCEAAYFFALCGALWQLPKAGSRDALKRLQEEMAKEVNFPFMCSSSPPLPSLFPPLFLPLSKGARSRVARAPTTLPPSRVPWERKFPSRRKPHRDLA